MTLRLEVPGRPPVELSYLLLDVNGTLSERGDLIEGVEERLKQLGTMLEIRLLSADSFGTVAQVAARLGVRADSASDQKAKHAAISSLGPERCVAIGNGANDAAMLREAAVGLAVIGPEGAAVTSITSADLVARSIVEALDLLLDPRMLAATLRD